MRILIAVLSGVLVAVTVYGFWPDRHRQTWGPVNLQQEAVSIEPAIVSGEIPVVQDVQHERDVAIAWSNYDRQRAQAREWVKAGGWDEVLLAEAKAELIRRGEVVEVSRP